MLDKYADKLILLTLYFTFVGLVVFFTLHTQDMDNVHWAREQAGLVVGAIVGLVTGYKLGQRSVAPPAEKDKDAQ